MSDVNVLVGYKNTEIGTIPEDWEVVELGNQSKQISSGRNTKDKNGIYPLYGSTGLIGRCTDYSYNQQAILVARVGANAGLVNLVNGKYGVSDNTIIIDLNDNNNIHFIKSWLIKKDLNTLVFGSGQPLITGTQLKKLLIVKPPKQEQTAIATALSDVDNLTQSLERLISKKEAIKTASMQQLLTGKTRLPEFATHDDGSKKELKLTDLGQIPEDWEVTPLGNLSTQIKSGKNIKDKSGIYPLYGSTGEIGKCKMYSYNQEAILVARVGANAGQVNFVNGKYGVSDNTLIINVSSDNDVQFIKSWLIQKDLNTLVFGSGQPLITGTQLKKLLIASPHKLEQTAIATILSDMDAEIQALHNRLTKTQDIKQGMMQQLLTGRVRLVSPSDDQNIHVSADKGNN